MAFYPSVGECVCDSIDCEVRQRKNHDGISPDRARAAAEALIFALLVHSRGSLDGPGRAIKLLA